MKNRRVVEAVLGARAGVAAVALAALVVVFAASGAFASQLVLNSTGGGATLGSDFKLTGSAVANPAGTLSIDCPITSVGGGTTLDYKCTGGSFTFNSSDGSTIVSAAFGVADLYLSASGGGRGGNIHYYYSFYGNFTGTQTVNGVSAAIEGGARAAIGPLRSQIGSGGATACCAAAGINSAYTPLYITDYSDSQLVRTDDLLGTNKQVLGSTGTGVNQFYGPHGVTGDASGRIYVADTYNCRIVRVNDITGAGWTTFGSCGAGANQFSTGGLSDIALDSSGKIYVADPGNNRVVRFDDMTGANWTSFGTAGAGTNQLSGAQGVAVDASGKIYIADGGNKRLVRIDDMTGTNWTVLTQSPVINGYIYSFGAPSHVALDPAGRILVGDGNNVIRVDDMTGTNWAGINTGTTVEGLSVDSGGTTFVAGTTSSGGAGVALFDDVTTGAGFNTSNVVAMTGGIYAVPVPAPVPAVSVVPSSLVFAQQNTGTTSAPQNVVLTNFGGAPLDIASILPTGDFTQTNNCGTSLPGGSNCTIAVTYAPQVTGPEVGTVTISDNAFTGTQTIALTGTGTAAVASISPASVSFQPQLLGSASGGQLVFLSNTGTGPLTFSGSGIATSGDFGQTNNCGAALAPATSCVITVAFTPTATGPRTGSLSVTSNGAPLAVSLSGTGTSAAPTVTAAPESLVFSTQLVKTKSPVQAVTLTNSGTTAVSVSTGISGDFAKTGSCPKSLSAGKSCTLKVTFTPTAAGTRTGALTFTLSTGSVTVALTGTGVSSATGWLTFSPSSFDFSNGYIVGDNPSQDFTVTNTNGVPTGISKISMSGSKTFTQTNNCGTMLAPYATCTVTVTFTPTVVGTFTGTLNVTESSGTAHKIALSGTAGTDSGGGN